MPERARSLGFTPGALKPGRLNALTDVAGVRVGHVTLIEGDRTRTGATAILPHAGNLYRERVPAGLAVLNGYGKLAGATQLLELGELETPILLTNTLATGRAIDALIAWTLKQPGNEHVVSINAVIGETNDSRLNDIRAARPSRDEMLQALATAAGGPVAEGCVGAGTGTVAFGVKGGIGTASRVLGKAQGGYTLGVLVQSNYGGALRLDGSAFADAGPAGQNSADKDGSIMIVLATDAPLSDRNLTRLAQRAFGGLARTGAALSNGSGDYAIAFSTALHVRRNQNDKPPRLVADLPNERLSPLFEAAIEASEEAILNSILMATSMDGFDAAKSAPNRVEALSSARVRVLAAQRNGL